MVSVKRGAHAGRLAGRSRRQAAAPLLLLAVSLVLLLTRQPSGSGPWLSRLVPHTKDGGSYSTAAARELLPRLLRREDQLALERRWGVEPVLAPPSAPPGARIPRILHHGELHWLGWRWRVREALLVAAFSGASCVMPSHHRNPCHYPALHTVRTQHPLPADPPAAPRAVQCTSPTYRPFWRPAPAAAAARARSWRSRAAARCPAGSMCFGTGRRPPPLFKR